MDGNDTPSIGASFIKTWPREAARLARDGLYDPAEEHEACGVGLVAAIDGKLPAITSFSGLILHLLKWQYQTGKRSNSWKLSIDNARSEIYERLTEMPSLRGVLAEVVQSEYRRARRSAAQQTKQDLARFPEQCPYTLAQLVDSEFLPSGNGK